MPEKKQINLYKDLPLEKRSPTRKFLGWLSTSGKAIIIVTNIITIGAFVYRVKIDQEKIDLKDKLTVYEKIVTANLNFERHFRQYQRKINILKEISHQARISDSLQIVEESIPYDAVLMSFQLDKKQVTLTLKAESGGTLSLMVASLIDKGAKEVVLKEANLKDEHYQFGLGVVFGENE